MNNLLGKAYCTKINYPAYECRQSEGIFVMKPLGVEITNDLFTRRTTYDQTISEHHVYSSPENTL